LGKHLANAKSKDLNKIKAIHAAAMKLVINTGFSNMKMADVASEANLTTDPLYIYYIKDELINDIF